MPQPPIKISELLGKKLNDFLKEFGNEEKIWHISDLHVGNTISILGVFDGARFRKAYNYFFNRFPLIRKLLYQALEPFLNPGHSDFLSEKFLETIKEHNRASDLFIITGDLTKKGAKKEVEELQEVLQLIGDNSQIFSLPGNHDYWDGSSFISILFKSISFKRRRSFLQHFFERDLLSGYEEKPFRSQDFNVAGKDFRVIGVDSNFRERYSVAKGLFPLEYEFEIEELQSPNHINILALHHHLEDYLDDVENTLSYFKKVVALRVVNSYKAKAFINRNFFKVIMHGHKHKQDLKYFFTGTTLGAFVSSPSLFLDKYCPKLRLRFDKDEKIGFNVILPLARGIFIIFFELNGGDYKVSRIVPLSY